MVIISVQNIFFYDLKQIISSCIFSDTEDDFRKHYGLSYYENCKIYSKIFKCLTSCKSMGYKVFRMGTSCKCTCHELKTTTELPFFVWRTNGTTRQTPATYSPSLYHIVGTLSPPTAATTEENITTTINITDLCGHTTPASNATNVTDVPEGDSNSTDSEAATTDVNDGNGTVAGNASGSVDAPATDTNEAPATDDTNTEEPADPPAE